MLLTLFGYLLSASISLNRASVARYAAKTVRRSERDCKFCGHDQKDVFAAAVSLYPAYAVQYGDWRVVRTSGPGTPITRYVGLYKPLAPLLILIGEKDDWTPAEPCHKLAEAAPRIRQ